jgi:hypothetical protein
MVGVMLFVFGAALIINRGVFERLPRLEDEFAYLFQAKVFARGQFYVPRQLDEPVKVFWQPFVIQPETSSDGLLKRFGKYTPGWPLVLAGGAALNATWWINAILGTLSVALTYRIGREIFSDAVGVVGAILLAISPMALLLNSTLMSHTAALFFTLLFIYAYWRLMRPRKLTQLWRWSILGGVGLGWLVMMRPLTAVAIAAPIGIHALSRLLDSLDAKTRTKSVREVLLPLILMGLLVLPFAGFLFVFNYSVAGEWRSELYTLLWEYDQIGFGEGKGLMPGGHTLEFGWRNTQEDLKFWFRDVFGISLHADIHTYLEDNFGWGAGVGLSWALIVLGLIAGRKQEWIFILIEIFIALMVAQLLYWIGSSVQGSAVYSVRYYYEATGAVCLIAAYGIVAQIRAWGERTIQKPVTFRFYPGYLALIVIVVFSVIGYTPARFREPMRDWPGGLYGFNKVGQYQLEAVNRLRQPGEKVLVVVLRHPDPTIEDNWRDYGALMAVTSPFLDSEIVVARLFDTDGLAEFTQRFSTRKVLYQVGESLYTSLDDAKKHPAKS